MRLLLSIRRLCTLAAVCAISAVSAVIAVSVFSTALEAQVTPAIERPIPFDSAGRVMVMTPAAAARLELASTVLPMSGGYLEARLFQDAVGATVLVVQRLDGSVERYDLSSAATRGIRDAVSAGLRGQADRGVRDAAGGTGVVVSESAGNVFVRNQTLLGLIVYGPAMSAILSDAGGAAASGGYLLAAGTSFFASANLSRQVTITRAQASLSGHMALRGAVAGLAIAAVARADGGAEFGVPILVGALGGTAVGYKRARPMSDGEAAASGLGADMFALLTIGLAGAAGAFEPEVVEFSSPDSPEYNYTEERLRTRGRVAIYGAIAAGVAGYAVGPNYARRAQYNVTDGDVDVVFTSAVLGALAVGSLLPDDVGYQTAGGALTAGFVGGALLGDRFMARTRDRTGSEGTLIQLGTYAGALMGAGAAAVAEAGQNATLILATTGGVLGLMASDALVGPAPDAGPLRGVLQTSQRQSPSRVEFNLGALLGAVALGERPPTLQQQARSLMTRHPAAQSHSPAPVLRIRW